MVTAFIKFGDGRVSTDAAEANLAAALRDPGAVFWIDIARPEDEDYALLDDVFGFHPLAIEDAINRQQRPKIESYNHVGDACRQGYFYMVIHGVAVGTQGEAVTTSPTAMPEEGAGRERLEALELDMFVSERYMVSIHSEDLDALRPLQQRAQVDPRLVLDPGIDMLLYKILDRLVDAYPPLLDDLQDELDDLEEAAVNEPTTRLLTDIALKKRELLGLRRIIGPQREVVAQLTRGDVPFVREATRIYLRDVLDHLVRAVEMIELYRDIVVSTRDIYMSSISNNLNRVMKTLTIITVVALPMTVITSFYGMNFNPETIAGWGWLLNTPGGFWVSMLVIVGLVGGLLWVFRRKRWL